MIPRRSDATQVWKHTNPSSGNAKQAWNSIAGKIMCERTQQRCLSLRWCYYTKRRQ